MWPVTERISPLVKSELFVSIGKFTNFLPMVSMRVYYMLLEPVRQPLWIKWPPKFLCSFISFTCIDKNQWNLCATLSHLCMYMSKVDVAGKIRVLPANGGKFRLLFTSVLMVRIVQYAILPLNFSWIKFLKFPPLAGKIRILPARSTFGSVLTDQVLYYLKR